MEEDGLAEAFRTGSAEGFRAVYERYSGAVYAIALRILGDREGRGRRSGHVPERLARLRVAGAGSPAGAVAVHGRPARRDRPVPPSRPRAGAGRAEGRGGDRAAALDGGHLGGLADPDRPGHAARRGTGGGPGPALRRPQPRPDRPAAGRADRYGEVTIASSAPAAGLDAGASGGGGGMTSEQWLAAYLEQGRPGWRTEPMPPTWLRPTPPGGYALLAEPDSWAEPPAGLSTSS